MLSLFLALSLLSLPTMAVTPEAYGDNPPDAAPSEAPADTDAAPDFVPGVIPNWNTDASYPDYTKLAKLMDGSDVTIPETFNAVKEGWQAPIRNQKSNGLCWVFGSYGALEANIIKNGISTPDDWTDQPETWDEVSEWYPDWRGKTWDDVKSDYEQWPNFSELHMAYAASNYDGDKAGVNPYGWDRTPEDGGNREYASAYWMRGNQVSGAGNLGGPVSEKEQPYVNELYDEEHGVSSRRSISETASKPGGWGVNSVGFITGSQKASDDEAKVIKQAVMEYGAVGVSMYWEGDATADAGTDSTKYYNSEKGSFYLDEQKIDQERTYQQKQIDKNSPDIPDQNHMVVIVGWDDNYSKDNFNITPPNDGAWLVRNSWGTQWGIPESVDPDLRGYVWISYDDTNFPLDAFYVDGLEIYDPETVIYQYDYLGPGRSYYIITNTVCAQSYTVEKAGQSVQSVKVYSATPNTRIDVDIVNDFDPSKSYNQADDFQTRGSLTVLYAGWYTIELEEPFPLGDAGSEFTVLVRAQSDDGEGGRIGSIDENHAEGKTYFLDEYEWISTDDFHPENKLQWNYCVKAVTAPSSESPAPIDIPPSSRSRLTADVSLIDASDNSITAESLKNGAEVRPKMIVTQKDADLSTANVFLALYDPSGCMIDLIAWEIDLNAPDSPVETQTIPEGLDVSSAKIMILDDFFKPLMAAPEL